MYKIIKVKKGYSIQRPDGSIVNETIFDDKDNVKAHNDAKAYLERLQAMGWGK